MEANPYESSALLEQYLVFHYAPDEWQFPYDFSAGDAAGFPEKCVSAGLDLAGIGDKERALDLGCAVGRSTFELARHFKEVIGIDFSQAFVDAANQLKQDGRRQATLPRSSTRAS